MIGIVGLAVSRIAQFVNELVAPGVPDRILSTKLSGARVVMWVVAAIFGVIAVLVLEYDPPDAIGMASGADDVWNVLMLVAVTDAADALFERRLVRR